MLIAHVPRIFPDPSTQLNPCEENRCHQKCDEKGPDKFRSTRRNYSETQKRSSAHSPKKKTEIRFDRLQKFLFETVLHLIVREFSSSRVKAQIHQQMN